MSTSLLEECNSASATLTALRQVYPPRPKNRNNQAMTSSNPATTTATISSLTWPDKNLVELLITETPYWLSLAFVSRVFN